MYTMSTVGDTDNNITIVTDQDDMYISRRSLRITMLVITVAIILLFFLGVIGNLLSLRILFHQRMRNQVNIMLGAMCISDTLFLVHCFTFTGLNIYKKFSPTAGETVRVLLYPYLGAYGSVVTARITSCLTTLLCVERCVAVFYPMQARIICNKKNTIIAIISITLLTVIAFIPFVYKYKPVEVVKDENTTYFTLNKTDFYVSNVKFYSIYGTILNILFRFAPLVIIPILNICMIRAVHQAWRLRRDISGHGRHSKGRLTSKRLFSSSSQHRITIMLVIVAFTFIICIMPGAINSIITHIFPTYSRLGKYKNLYLFISSLTFLFETLNSSINFIIYMAMSRKFRLVYKEKCCCGHGKYYNKISVSSVKDRFKWVSSKKSTDSDQIPKASFRQIVSDGGPNKHNPVSRRALNNCIHSEEIPAINEGKNSDQRLWDLGSDRCIQCQQNINEENLSTVSYSLSERPKKRTGVTCKEKCKKENTKCMHCDCTRRTFQQTKDSLRNPRRKHDISNSDYYKMTINNIYYVNQELPFICDNTTFQDVLDKSK